MPLFHFNSQTGGVVLPDLEGEELPDVAVAREVAEESARESRRSRAAIPFPTAFRLLITKGTRWRPFRWTVCCTRNCRSIKTFEQVEDTPRT
jgi:hypothetical protein